MSVQGRKLPGGSSVGTSALRRLHAQKQTDGHRGRQANARLSFQSPQTGPAESRAKQPLPDRGPVGFVGGSRPESSPGVNALSGAKFSACSCDTLHSGNCRRISAPPGCPAETNVLAIASWILGVTEITAKARMMRDDLFAWRRCKLLGSVRPRWRRIAEEVI